MFAIISRSGEASRQRKGLLNFKSAFGSFASHENGKYIEKNLSAKHVAFSSGIRFAISVLYVHRIAANR
jgi:hypothetical protein